MHQILSLFCIITLAILPIYCDNEKRLNVSEDAKVDTLVGYVGSGPVSTNAFFYTIIYSPDDDTSKRFAINDKTGEIRTQMTLDYETQTTYTLLAIAVNSTDVIRVVIDVTDINDNQPIFAETTVQLQLSEYARLGARLPLPIATDADSSKYGIKEYRIASGNINNAFDLSTKLFNYVMYLDLIVNADLDRETLSHYTLRIEAVDMGQPPLIGTLSVNVTIVDENDNSPVFQQAHYSARVVQNSTIGTQVVQVSATDADDGDNSRVSYSFLSNDVQTYFAIDHTSGIVSIANPLPSTTPAEYNLLIVARDGGTPALETSIVANVKVVSSVGLNVDVVFNNSNHGRPSVSEGASVGTIIAQITITNNDNTRTNQLHVSMFGGREHFSLQSPTVGDSGLWSIIVSAPLDRETFDTYSLALAVSADVTLWSDNFTVNILDVNDNAPRFSRDVYDVEMYEDTAIGTAIFTMNAFDVDVDENSRITYGITRDNQPGQGWFVIDEHSGVITTRELFNCNISARPHITVTATDGGTPSMSAIATVRVFLLFCTTVFYF